MSIDAVVDALCASAAEVVPAGGGRLALPSLPAVLAAVEDLREAFFPGYFREVDLPRAGLRTMVAESVCRALAILRDQVRRGIAFAGGHDFETCVHCAARAAEVDVDFLEQLPSVRRRVATDVEAAFLGDPALQTRQEAIYSYPGILAITHQRLAHELHLLSVPLIPRMITEHAHALTGIDIHPGAMIGEGFFIDHGTGVVIGETARIGRNVRLYQGVTLGAKSFSLDQLGHPVKGLDRHPILEDDVIVYAGASILGRVTIGRGSTIGGNVWLTSSVPPGSHVSQARPLESRFAQGAGI